jgi:regulator of sigma E protease
LIENPGLIVTMLAFVAVIGPLVFVHEFGHYIVGRWCGVRAETFSIGFGRELAAWVDNRGTRWRLGLLPLGGYVKFKGDMNAASQTDPKWLEMPAAERAQSFPAKSVGQRAAIVLAGPAINFLFAILLLGGLAYVKGDPQSPPIIGGVQQGSAASGVGLRPGDRIVSIMGRNIEAFADIPAIVVLRPAEPLPYVIDRHGVRIDVTIAADTRVEKDRFGNEYRFGQLGLRSAPLVYRKIALWEVPIVGIRQSRQALSSMIDGLGQIVTARRSVKELGGPLKIAEISGQAASLGIASFVMFVALISINLGFINLLPIPMLDGGHLLFYAVEAVQRRPVSPQVQEWAYRSGMAVLLTVMVLVTFNDLSSFGLWKSLSGLIG